MNRQNYERLRFVCLVACLLSASSGIISALRLIVWDAIGFTVLSISLFMAANLLSHFIESEAIR